MIPSPPRPTSYVDTIRTRGRNSIRGRLATSHLAAVTASTFVYAAGGFFLLMFILFLNGYTLESLRRLFPQFFGVTVFVLIQIALITLCGLVVARIAARMVSRDLLRQIAELEEGSRAIAEGRLNRRVRVLTDDELGRFAERFNELTTRLADADQQRRAFVANISHDLRTPIAIIRGHLDAQLDAERGDDLPVQESLAAIDREVDTLASLIDDLFTLSRLEEGVLPVDAAAFDVAALARESAAAIRPYALSAARVSVNAQVAEELPHALGDPTRTTQVINNLLHNAVRHTPEGGVVMVIAELDTSRTWIHVTVRDTGVGIPPDVLERIFDRYYRGDTIGEKGGAGIGLSIVSQLVQMQGGQVWAESNVGEGTAISFSLRVASPQ